MTDKKNIIILIVDDDPLNLKLLKGTFLQEGYQVIMAMNGQEARQLVIEEPPDIILLDIMMPGENGFEVIKRLKEDSRSLSIPVIFLTAVDELEPKIRGFRNMTLKQEFIQVIQPMILWLREKVLKKEI